MRAVVIALAWSLAVPLARPAPAAEIFPVAAGAALAPTLSPEGAAVAFVSDVSGIPQVWTVPVAGGWPAQVTHGAEPVCTVRWSPDGKWLAYAALSAGGSTRGLYVVRPDGKAGRRFTAPADGWSWLGAWSPDGTWIGFGAARRGGKLLLGLYAPRANAVRSRFPAGGPVRLTAISSDRRRLLVQRFDPTHGWQVYLRRTRSARETLLTPHRGKACSRDAVFGPGGESVYLVTDAQSDRPALARVRLEGSAAKPGPIEILAQRADADLERLVAAAGGRWAALLWNAAGRSRLSLVDLATGRLAPGPDIPGEVVHGLSVTNNGRKIAVSASGPAMPPDVWLIDRTAGKVRRLTNVPHGGLDLGKLVRPRLARFRSHDGVELDGWLYQARGPAPSPMVVSVHDGLEGEARPAFQPLIQAIVQSGISVFAPNVRGSGGRGRNFADLDDGPQRLNAIRDVQACAEWLAASGRAASGRLGILGWGYGGYLALAALTSRPKLFAAGVLIGGFADLEALLETAAPWLAPLLEAEYGNPVRQRDMLRALSPIHRLEHVRTPLLLLHGRNDPIVPVEEAEKIAARLEKAGIESKLVVFEGEGHRLLRRENRRRAARLAVEWFRRRLKP